MTCIAAVAHEGRVWMGGDSAGTNEHDYSLGLHVETKVWFSGGLLFGACGSFRVAQVIRHHMNVPAYDADTEPIEYITGALVDAMRYELETRGTLSVWEEDATQAIHSSGMLVALAGRVFELYEDFGVGELVDGFTAIGCGAPWAMGALAATPTLRPDRRVRTALEVSERFNAGVRAPFVIVHS